VRSDEVAAVLVLRTLVGVLVRSVLTLLFAVLVAAAVVVVIVLLGLVVVAILRCVLVVGVVRVAAVLVHGIHFDAFHKVLERRTTLVPFALCLLVAAVLGIHVLVVPVILVLEDLHASIVLVVARTGVSVGARFSILGDTIPTVGLLAPKGFVPSDLIVFQTDVVAIAIEVTVHLVEDTVSVVVSIHDLTAVESTRGAPHGSPGSLVAALLLLGSLGIPHVLVVPTVISIHRIVAVALAVGVVGIVVIVATVTVAVGVVVVGVLVGVVVAVADRLVVLLGEGDAVVVAIAVSIGIFSISVVAVVVVVVLVVVVALEELSVPVL